MGSQSGESVPNCEEGENGGQSGAPMLGGGGQSQEGGMSTSDGGDGTPARSNRHNLAKMSRGQLLTVLWRKFLDKEDSTISSLRGLLYKYQRDVYDALASNTAKRFVILCRRRRGKSFTLLVYAIEQCFNNKKFMVRYAAPTQRQLEKIIHPIVQTILEYCPRDERPKWNGQKGCYVFPQTKSELHLAGTDGGNAENLRGTASHLNILDEAGSASDLDYIVKSILAPQTMTTGGRTLLASTPSVSPEHPFKTMYLAAKVKGNTIERSIYDDRKMGVIDDDTWADCVEDSGGERTTHFRREYGIEFVVEEHLAIIPEWQEQIIAAKSDPAKSPIVSDPPILPQHYGYLDKYTSLDVGTVHWTVALFGVYDFDNATLHIEDEWFMRGSMMTTEKIANGIKEKEKALWNGQKPRKRICDSNNKQLLQDMRHLHQLSIQAVQKTRSGSSGALEAMVNRLRQFVRQGRLTVHPRCKLLITTLESGIWNDTRREFKVLGDVSDQTGEDGAVSGIGHSDAIASLMYMIRHIDEHHNPIPAYLGTSNATHYYPDGTPRDPGHLVGNKGHSAVKEIFKRS